MCNLVFKGLSSITTALLTRFVVEDIYNSYKSQFSQSWIKGFVVYCSIYNGTYNHKLSFFLTAFVLLMLSSMRMHSPNVIDNGNNRNR